jgi:hypothetical protein
VLQCAGHSSLVQRVAVCMRLVWQSWLLSSALMAGWYANPIQIPRALLLSLLFNIIQTFP